MGIRVTHTGQAPTRAWDRQAMAFLADAAKGAVIARTFYQGIGEDGAPLAPYSTRPMTVTFASPLARRLKPKGGEPAWGRGHPRRLGPRKWKVVGRYYKGGYAQFKSESRKGPRNAEVDLVLSGTLMRPLRVKRVTLDSATIGISGRALAYGGAVDARRPFMGLGPADEETMQVAFETAVNAAARRSARGAG